MTLSVETPDFGLRFFFCLIPVKGTSPALCQQLKLSSALMTNFALCYENLLREVLEATLKELNQDLFH
jgi:hypothetical protein